MRALVLLSALLASAPVIAGSVRFSWAPNAETDVAVYLVERAEEAGWVEVARIPATPEAPEFNPSTGTFSFESPIIGDPGRWRLVAVDHIGNASPPVYLLQDSPPSSCTWRPSFAPWSSELAVAVDCGCSPCDCAEVSRRLDSARRDILGVIGSEEGRMLDWALARTTVEIVGPEQLVTPKGMQAAGYAGEGRMLLARDLRAAAHELFHVYLDAVGVPSEQQHADPRFAGIDRKHGTGAFR